MAVKNEKKVTCCFLRLNSPNFIILNYQRISNFLKRSFRRLLFLYYKVKLKIKKSNNYITCEGKKDGGGAQIHAVLSTQMFAKQFNIKYAHTPFKKIEHKPKSMPELEWMNSWECFFNLGKGYEEAKQINAKKIKTTSLFKALKYISLKEKYIVVVPHCHRYADMYPQKYISFFEKYKPKDKIKLKNKNKLYVAVHIRRGDVSEKERKRYTSSKKILKTISLIKRKYPNKELETTIYSNDFYENLVEDFQDYKIDVDSNVFDVLSNLSNADILIMGKSSLSYIAGLYSKGEVYYEPFWHSPLPNWHIIE
jgi:hypothetical protein